MTAREFTIPGQNRFTVTGEGYGTQGTMTLAERYFRIAALAEKHTGL
jgi:hypothetical protein